MYVFQDLSCAGETVYTFAPSNTWYSVYLSPCSSDVACLTDSPWHWNYLFSKEIPVIRVTTLIDWLIELLIDFESECCKERLAALLLGTCINCSMINSKISMDVKKKVESEFINLTYEVGN